MSSQLSVRFSPAEIAGLQALVEQEGGTVVGHIRAGVRLRLDRDEQRQVVARIVRDEVKDAIKAARDVMREELRGAIEQMQKASLAADETNRMLLADFLRAVQSLPPVAPKSTATDTTTASGDLPMPTRVR